MEEKIKLLKDKIVKSQKIVLINHIKMDPDAFWSLISFYYILKELKKDVIAINDEKMPESFSFYNTWKIIHNDINLNNLETDLIIAFDSGSTEQLWDTYKNNLDYFDKNYLIVIDHHKTNKWYWDLNIINSLSSSTCELVFDIFEKFKWEKYITPQIATLLLWWIHTDTNVFYNSNTTENTHLVAAKLLKYWADFRTTIYNFFQKSSFEKTKLFSATLSNLEKKWKIIYSTITQKDFSDNNANEHMTSWFINQIINIDGCEIAILLYEMKKWWVKVSFRAKNFSVWDFCTNFPWWWWHKLAAWFRTEKNINEILKEILEGLNKENI